MTVAELVALLANFPLTSSALVDGYEGGLEDVTTLALVPIQADVKSKSCDGGDLFECAGFDAI